MQRADYFDSNNQSCRGAEKEKKRGICEICPFFPLPEASKEGFVAGMRFGPTLFGLEILKLGELGNLFGGK
ncbi:hypothetical protein MRB53_017817 [Persea americana]|uniref:Uncharacterized protein n=1 Tax=Persea americana TaxID=3435 RepID=A0ACC2M670_PERAE|nr:hypothetical protein MRB53_017817 [Persea americana]